MSECVLWFIVVMVIVHGMSVALLLFCFIEVTRPLFKGLSRYPLTTQSTSPLSKVKSLWICQLSATYLSLKESILPKVLVVLLWTNQDALHV